MDSSKLSGNKQQGLTLVSLIFLLAMLGMVGVTLMKVVPSFMEYRAILNGIKLAKAKGGTAREMQAAFDSNAGATYIDSISGKDLIIGAENGQLEISFAYDKKIPLVGFASLLLEYAGTTSKGAPATKPAE
ncbi:type II secretory pathway pseudopilin PulG [Oxalobacteraceae bacterium GrIS 1.11]